MRNIMLIARREYLERVRAKSFLLSTIGLPLLIGASMILPGKLATMKSTTVRHIAVAANPQLAASLKQQLEVKRTKDSAGDDDSAGELTNFRVEIAAGTTEEVRQELTARAERGELDAFLWVPDDALAGGKVSYSGRELSDFVDVAAIKRAVTRARQEHLLAQHGVAQTDISSLLQPVAVETTRIERGKSTKTNTLAGMMSSIVLVMMLYVVLLIYGIAVMRSVVEEKTSRVMEVLLSSVSSRELMAGKILGVGAVGFTQVAVWITMIAAAALPMAAASGLLRDVHISGAAIAAFAVFFVLGYLLYSAIYAAMGAMINSEQEGQQLQVVGMAPLLISITLMMFVIRQPNSPLAMWMSLVPFFSPLLMYLRISVQPPPVWQIATSIVLLVLTIWGTMELCGRIYRVGILMYGKRPTLPELRKWLKYAK